MRPDEERFCFACCKMLPHRFRPSPEAGPFWRCSECGRAQDERSPAAVRAAATKAAKALAPFAHFLAILESNQSMQRGEVIYGICFEKGEAEFTRSQLKTAADALAALKAAGIETEEGA